MRIESVRRQNDDHEDDENDFKRFLHAALAPRSMKTAFPLG